MGVRTESLRKVVGMCMTQSIIRSVTAAESLEQVC